MEDISMTLDNNAISIIMAIITSVGLFLNAIVHWNKIRPVLFSHVSSVVAEYALVFGCFWMGQWAILIGANVFITIVFIDFVHRGDNSCARIGYAILTTALGVFNFAIQFAFAVNGK